MLGLLVMLLFGVTGFTINHEAWYDSAAPRLAEREAQVPTALIAQHDNLRIVEHLRQALGIRGALANFTELDDTYELAFKEPGQVWDLSIEKTTGRTTARSEQYGLAAIL